MNRLQPLLKSWRYAARHRSIRAALASLLFLLLATAIALGFWWPAQRERQALITDIETQRKAAIDAMHAADVARAYRNAKLAADLLEQKLNAVGGQADLVKSIERVAAKCHVRIVSQAYEEGKLKNTYPPLYLDIGLQANYSALREFLMDLGGLPVWVEIQEINLERSREHPGLIKASLRLLTYRKASNRVASAP